ncbi:hypothetical protein CPT_MarsHill_262 [Staphylococcus phage MarsHill]|nr:hypothetical protein CPT_MarsHill_262 [Staphylococcus phage MarsHill]
MKYYRLTVEGIIFILNDCEENTTTEATYNEDENYVHLESLLSIGMPYENIYFKDRHKIVFKENENIFKILINSIKNKYYDFDDKNMEFKVGVDDDEITVKSPMPSFSNVNNIFNFKVDKEMDIIDFIDNYKINNLIKDKHYIEITEKEYKNILIRNTFK